MRFYRIHAMLRNANSGAKFAAKMQPLGKMHNFFYLQPYANCYICYLSVALPEIEIFGSRCWGLQV
jgi:hypothetical protein